MEFNENELKMLAENFCYFYNKYSSKNYNFYDADNDNYDFRIKDGRDVLKIQCKVAIAEEKKDFINLEYMFRGKKHEKKKSYTLIHDDERFKYTLEHVFDSKIKKLSYSDCILLVIFKHFPFGDDFNEEYYIKSMQRTGEKYKEYVKEIWIGNEPNFMKSKYGICIKII